MRPYERSSSIHRLGIALAIGCAAVVAVSMSGPGATVIGVCYHFLEFYAGVFSLVALSLTVMGGLAATDRLLLLVRHRVLLQAVHRATAFASVGFLLCHELTKLAEKHADLVDVLVPFLAPRKTVVIGLGTVAGYGLVIAAWTGIVRGRFAAVPAAWMWRALHSAAYVAWPVALIHGLTAGRHAAAWVIVSYAACAILVVLALCVRIIATWNRASAAPKTRPAGRSPGAHVRAAGQPLRAPRPAHARGYGASSPAFPVADSEAPAPEAPAHDALSYNGLGYGAMFYEVPVTRGAEGAGPASGYGVFEAVPYEPDIHDVGGGAEIPVPRRPFESVSDDEFWAYLRGKDSP